MMKIIVLLLVSFNIFAKTEYKVLTLNYKKAVRLWENGNNKEAFDIFEKNSQENHPPSMFYLGLYHLYGFNTVEISYDTAFYFINKAAEKGYLKAALQRIILYYYGIGVPKDREIAKHKFSEVYPYFKLMNNESKSFLLILSNLKAMTNNKRNKYLRKLIKKVEHTNSRLAKINLIFFYRTLRYYIYLNKRKVKKLIKAEIKTGNAEAEALYYEEFHNNLKKIEVLDYIFKAAKQGDATSQYNLYLYYNRKKNKRKKIFWLKKAAKNGSKYARKKLKERYKFMSE